MQQLNNITWHADGYPWLGRDHPKQIHKYKDTNTKMQVVIHGWGMSALNNDQVEPVDDMALK